MTNSIPENMESETKTDLENNFIYQSNDLVMNAAKMDALPLKVFELIISCIDPLNPPKDYCITLSKAEIFSILGLKSENKYSRLKNVIIKLHKQTVFNIKKELKKNRYEMEVVSPFASTKWNDNTDHIEVMFTKPFMPYISDFNNNYTKYALSDIVKIDGKYGIILYKWINMHYRQYEYYLEKGSRREKQLEEFKNPYITIEKFREATDTVNRYPYFTDLNKWAIKAAVNEININTDFKITYDKIKEGTKVVGIQFHINHVTDLEYKKNDQSAQANLEKKREEEDILFAKAIQSKYTTNLLAYGLITALDMQDKNTMVDLQTKVYAKYDKLNELRGGKAIEQHISYVKAHIIDYSKKNTVKYLNKSIDDYLSKLEK